MPLDAEPAGAATTNLTPLQLFLAFTRIGLSSFGQLIPIARHALVQRHKWLTDAEFAEMLAIGQMLPGPNVVNVSAALGDRHAGWAGAFASVAGLVLPPSLVAIGIASTLYMLAHDPHVAGALAGMAAAAAGLVLATAFRLARASIAGWIGVAITLAIFAAVAVLRLPLAAVLAVSLPLTLWAHGALRRSG
jgi:chromate transporter